jgi:adenylate cyclase
MQQEKDSGLMTVRFSIGAKLITIITFIVLISLSSINALVSWLVRGDLRVAAEENNFEANRYSAMAAETAFHNVLSNSLVLMRTITSAGTGSTIARESLDFFFERHPEVAAVFFTAGTQTELLVNERFFDSGSMDSSLAASYRDANQVALMRAAAGETVLLNAAPHFAAPVLALFFPWQSGGGGVLFVPME